MSVIELIISGFLIICVALFIYFIFKGKLESEIIGSDSYSIDFLCDTIKNNINEIINMDIDILNLNKKDFESRKALKRYLSDAIRKCSQGNLSEKMFVIAKIKSNLLNILKNSEDHINDAIPFHIPEKLTSTEKFEILMYLEKREGNVNMFHGICSKCGLNRLKKDVNGYFYSVTKEDMNEAYHKLSQPLSYDDKLNIISQRIYEETYGLSIADLLIMEDNSLDGVSGGISGITKDNYHYAEEDLYNDSSRKPYTYESIWIIYQGKPIHLKFLTLKTNSNMMRICKNLSEHGRIGHLTSSEGGMKTHLADGSRITIFRPNNSTQWAFFIRKFTSTSSYDLKNLINDKGSEYPIGVIQWAIRGCLNMVFSGDQNSGKTTNMRAAIREIDRRQPIRSMEADFELFLNDAYQDMNILGVRPSDLLNFPKLVELLKSSDAHTILFGETASLEHAKHLINLLLAGTKRIITTGHWPTTDELIAYFVHAMGAYGGSGTEEVEALVARLLHIDIHCVKDNDGHRHIDRITEIIPIKQDENHLESCEGIEGQLEVIAYYLKLLARKKSYSTRDIIIYEEGEYRMVNPFSDRLTKIIVNNLPPEDKLLFQKFNSIPEGGIRKAC